MEKTVYHNGVIALIGLPTPTLPLTSTGASGQRSGFTRKTSGTCHGAQSADATAKMRHMGTKTDFALSVAEP